MAPCGLFGHETDPHLAVPHSSPPRRPRPGPSEGRDARAHSEDARPFRLRHAARECRSSRRSVDQRIQPLPPGHVFVPPRWTTAEDGIRPGFRAGIWAEAPSEGAHLSWFQTFKALEFHSNALWPALARPGIT